MNAPEDELADPTSTRPLAVTVGAAIATLVVIGAIVAGPVVTSCVSSPDGLGACLHNKLVDAGLVSKPAAVVAASSTTTPPATTPAKVAETPPAAPVNAADNVTVPTDTTASPETRTGSANPTTPAETTTLVKPTTATKTIDTKAADAMISATFGLVRVQPDGSAVIAGSAKPGDVVQVFADNKLIGETRTGPSGDWAIVPEKPLPAGGVELTLGVKGTDQRAPKAFVVAIDPGGKTEPLVVASVPGKASIVLQGLADNSATAPAPSSAVANAPESTVPESVAPQKPAVGDLASVSGAQTQAPAAMASAKSAPTVSEVKTPETKTPETKTPQTKTPQTTTVEPSAMAPKTVEPVTSQKREPAKPQVEPTTSAKPAPGTTTPVTPAPDMAVAIAEPPTAPTTPADKTPPANPSTPESPAVTPTPVPPAAKTPAPIIEAPASAPPELSPTPEPGTGSDETRSPKTLETPKTSKTPKVSGTAPPEIASVAPNSAVPAPSSAARAPSVAPELAVTADIDAIEIDGTSNFFAGNGPEGATVRLYVDDKHIADTVVSGGRWLIDAQNVLTKQKQLVRIDVLEPGSAKVVARAEVNFRVDLPKPEKPEAKTPAAIAQASEPTPAPVAPPAPSVEPAPMVVANTPGTVPHKAEPDVPPAVEAPVGKTPAAGKMGAQAPMTQAPVTKTSVAPEQPAKAELAPKSVPVQQVETAQAEPAKPAIVAPPPAGPAKGIETAPVATPQLPAPEPAPTPPVPKLSAPKPEVAAPTEPVTAAPEPVPSTPPQTEVATASAPATVPPPSVGIASVPTLVAEPVGVTGSGRFSSGKAIIRHGDNLWTIARRVYGHGVKYTTIFEANSTQIRDPNLIYPGQVFDLPKAGGAKAPGTGAN